MVTCDNVGSSVGRVTATVRLSMLCQRLALVKANTITRDNAPPDSFSSSKTDNIRRTVFFRIIRVSRSPSTTIFIQLHAPANLPCIGDADAACPLRHRHGDINNTATRDCCRTFVPAPSPVKLLFQFCRWLNLDPDDHRLPPTARRTKSGKADFCTAIGDQE